MYCGISTYPLTNTDDSDWLELKNLQHPKIVKSKLATVFFFVPATHSGCATSQAVSIVLSGVSG